jgi:hypothetical protein
VERSVIHILAVCPHLWQIQHSPDTCDVTCLGDNDARAVGLPDSESNLSVSDFSRIAVHPFSTKIFCLNRKFGILGLNKRLGMLWTYYHGHTGQERKIA